MKFEAHANGAVAVRLLEEEARLLGVLASEVTELLSDSGDPALARLLPDAYRDDDEAAAEFRRFTEGELVELKARNAATVVSSLEAWPEVELNRAATIAWLRALTDIRIVLANRLGIEQDDDEGDTSTEEGAMLRDVYDWLGALQATLVDAVDD